jgi:hypothetical protein
VSTDPNREPRATSLEPADRNGPTVPAADTCDVCGATNVHWRNCKLVCGNCRAIVKSCADL